MSVRSDELRRQRDLLREQLKSIEEQLAAEESIARVTGDPVPPLRGRPPRMEATEAESILEQYRQPSDSIARKTKRGCILYVVLALGLVFAAVALFYFLEHAGKAR